MLSKNLALQLQPFTPCLPIRDGKLQTSKNFSSSNPQLPYICSSLSTYINNTPHHHHHPHHVSNSSTPSINSSVIWREACPNSFLYASSISSLSSSPYKSRFSSSRVEIRAASEERPSHSSNKTQKTPSLDNNSSRLYGNVKKQTSNYDNHFNSSSASNSPLVTRKSTGAKFWQGKIQATPSMQVKQKAFNTIASGSREKSSFLYDRRLNKSFETANGLMMDEIPSRCPNEKNSLFRRSSTPQLHSLYYDGNSRDSINSSWCCGNFVLKQWKKMNQYWNFSSIIITMKNPFFNNLKIYIKN